MIATRSLLLVSTLCLPLAAQEGYRRPPEPLATVIDAPPAPTVSTSPDGSHLLLISRENMPSIATQSRPILRLAGRRIDPASRGPQRGARATAFTLLSVANGTERPIAVPEDADLGSPVWNADGSKFAFTNTTDAAIELWVAETATATARQIPRIRLNAVLGSPIRWHPDQQRLLCMTVTGPNTPPERPTEPTGPRTQQSSGKKAPVRTFQDLLTDAHDADLFEYYATSQLSIVDPARNKARPFCPPGMISSVSASPDGQYFLITEIQRPFSFLVTWYSFPQKVTVYDKNADVTLLVATMPAAENVPIGGVLEGPRRTQWIPTEPHSLIWVEALDGGDPKAEADYRDQVVIKDVAVPGPATRWMRTEHRYTSAMFGESGDLALVSEYDRDTRRTRTWKANPREILQKPAVLFDRSTQDVYGDPGRPLTTRTDAGKSVVRQQGSHIFLSGTGASPEGDRPFLDRHDLSTGETERVFHSRADMLERVSALLADDASQVLVRRETKNDFPNYFARDTQSGEERQLTQFTDAAAEVTGKISKQLLKYQRSDGIPLSGTLYLPPDYTEGERLPLLVWAYPREFNDAKNAGQMRGSVHRYTRLSGTSPLLLTLAGYAVLYNAAMPVVGPVETANDTFVTQLVDGARAAIDACVELGVADPDRVAISGHSYGAFMTANLLAHSDLFRAGVARSGAYNRTLTPFGFQNERRTFWEAPDTYFAMSPFMHAEKINEPLLLIHGEVDNNSGTFPIQSERLFHAVKGHGGAVRLVMLPHESHGYRARESVMHCMAETIDWLDQWVKGASTRTGGGGR